MFSVNSDIKILCMCGITNNFSQEFIRDVGVNHLRCGLCKSALVLPDQAFNEKDSLNKRIKNLEKIVSNYEAKFKLIKNLIMSYVEHL